MPLSSEQEKLLLENPEVFDMQLPGAMSSEEEVYWRFARAEELHAQKHPVAAQELTERARLEEMQRQFQAEGAFANHGHLPQKVIDSVLTAQAANCSSDDEWSDDNSAISVKVVGGSMLAQRRAESAKISKSISWDPSLLSELDVEEAPVDENEYPDLELCVAMSLAGLCEATLSDMPN